MYTRQVLYTLTVVLALLGGSVLLVGKANALTGRFSERGTAVSAGASVSFDGSTVDG